MVWTMYLHPSVKYRLPMIMPCFLTKFANLRFSILHDRSHDHNHLDDTKKHPRERQNDVEPQTTALPTFVFVGLCMIETSIDNTILDIVLCFFVGNIGGARQSDDVTLNINMTIASKNDLVIL